MELTNILQIAGTVALIVIAIAFAALAVISYQLYIRVTRYMEVTRLAAQRVHQFTQDMSNKLTSPITIMDYIIAAMRKRGGRNG